MEGGWLFFIFLPISIQGEGSLTGTVDVSSLQSHVLQLEETVASLQSQSQIQEQKQAAVLSSILSELSTLKDNYASLQAEVKILSEDLKSCQGNLTRVQDDMSIMQSDLNQTQETLHNITSEINSNAQVSGGKVSVSDLLEVQSELKEVNKSVSSELQIVKMELDISKANQTDMMTHLSHSVNEYVTDLKMQINNVSSIAILSGKNVASLLELLGGWRGNKTDLHVQAVQMREMTVKAGSPIRFDRLQYGLAGNYDNNTGTFKVPITGLYLFWINIIISKPQKPAWIKMVHNSRGANLGFSFASSEDRNGLERVTGMRVVYFLKGSRVYFTTNSDVVIEPSSNVVSTLLSGVP